MSGGSPLSEFSSPDAFVHLATELGTSKEPIPFSLISFETTRVTSRGVRFSQPVLRRLRWLHQRDLHPESLGLLQPIRERHTPHKEHQNIPKPFVPTNSLQESTLTSGKCLHVRRLALHLCAQLPILPRLRRASREGCEA